MKKKTKCDRCGRTTWRYVVLTYERPVGCGRKREVQCMTCYGGMSSNPVGVGTEPTPDSSGASEMVVNKHKHFKHH